MKTRQKEKNATQNNFCEMKNTVIILNFLEYVSDSMFLNVY